MTLISTVFDDIYTHTLTLRMKEQQDFIISLFFFTYSREQMRTIFVLRVRVFFKIPKSPRHFIYFFIFIHYFKEFIFGKLFFGIHIENCTKSNIFYTVIVHMFFFFEKLVHMFIMCKNCVFQVSTSYINLFLLLIFLF